MTTPSPTSRTDRRLQSKLDPDELLQAWARGWISRDGRMHTLFAARTLDYVVLTDRHLHLFSTGFFTRRARRRVFTTPLDRLTVSTRKGDDRRHLRIRTADHRRPLLVDLRHGARGDALAALLLTDPEATSP